MILVDANGLPVAVSTASANRAERNLIQELLAFLLTAVKGGLMIVSPEGGVGSKIAR